MWIYKKSTKRWFTPDEFQQFIEPVREHKRRQGNGYEDYVIRDPKDGLRERIAVLEKVHKELQSYSEKLFTFFQIR